MKKLKHNEVRMAAQIMADCFADYPLYKAFFPNDSLRKFQLYYFCWYYIYIRRDFTYLSEDNSSLISAQQPGDRIRSGMLLLLNPSFLFGAVRNLPLRSLMLLPGYAKLSNALTRSYFQSKHDWFIHILCVTEKARARGFFKVLNDMDIGQSLYCFTHSARNARLYQLIGFEILQETTWHDVSVYTMRRERKFDTCGSSL